MGRNEGNRCCRTAQGDAAGSVRALGGSGAKSNTSGGLALWLGEDVRALCAQLPLAPTWDRLVVVPLIDGATPNPQVAAKGGIGIDAENILHFALGELHARRV